MGKGCYGNRYLQTKRGAAAVATIVIAFVLLVLLNVEGYFYGPLPDDSLPELLLPAQRVLLYTARSDW
ncbi:hypothetical protein MTO96_029433 [Rhipicephalus appendiculatus]